MIKQFVESLLNNVDEVSYEATVRLEESEEPQEDLKREIKHYLDIADYLQRQLFILDAEGCVKALEQSSIDGGMIHIVVNGADYTFPAHAALINGLVVALGYFNEELRA